MVLLFLTGCWDRQEVNDIAIVLGGTLDLEEDGKIRGSIQYALPGQLGGPEGGGGGTSGQKSWNMDSAVSVSVKGITDELQRSTSRQLEYSHRRVLLLGENLARAGIGPALDTITRTPQSRLTVLLAVVKGDPRDTYTTDSYLERFPAEMARELLIFSTKELATMKVALKRLMTEGHDLTLPYLTINETEPGQQGKPNTNIQVDGVAVFHKDKMKGVLQDDEASGLLWAMNQIRRPSLMLDAPDGSGKLAFQLYQQSVKKDVTIRNGRVVEARLVIKGKGVLQENTSSFATTMGSMAEIEQAAKEKIRKMVEASVHKVQTEYHSDCLGIGNLIKRRHPKIWKTIRQDWGQLYPTIPIVVDVTIHMEHGGTMYGPFLPKIVQ